LHRGRPPSSSLLTLGALMTPAVAKSRKAVPAPSTFAASGDLRNYGIDFVNLDNATSDQFDGSQLKRIQAAPS